MSLLRSFYNLNGAFVRSAEEARLAPSGHGMDLVGVDVGVGVGVSATSFVSRLLCDTRVCLVYSS